MAANRHFGKSLRFEEPDPDPLVAITPEALKRAAVNQVNPAGVVLCQPADCTDGDIVKPIGVQIAQAGDRTRTVIPSDANELGIGVPKLPC